MTTIVNQVTCSLSNEKIGEPKWEEHIISTTNLKKSRDVNSEIVIKFSEVAIDSLKSRAAIYEIRNEKTCFSGGHIFQQKYQKKLDKTSSHSNCLGDLMNYLTPHFDNLLQELTPNVCEKHFNLMFVLTFCEICKNGINKDLLYDHTNSKEHRDTESYSTMK